MTLQLYLHFPFCKRKCYYCDFFSGKASETEQRGYAALLEKEIRLAAEKYEDITVSTLFFGGGTPSLMPLSAMERIWQTLSECFTLSREAEYTVEANPGTLTEEWLLAARRYGVNRLSIGVQAAQDGILKSLGRIHTFQEAKEAATLARACGFQNINIDVMFGLPGQTVPDYLETLGAVREWNPSHISAYSLIVEPETELFRRVECGECHIPEEDETAEMYQKGRGWLEREGYAQYEISNFAREGQECRHNLGYWQGAWYLGLGLNAHSMLPGKSWDGAYIRTENTSDLKEYLESLEAGKLPICRETVISDKEAMFETMMLGLRTLRGVGFEDFHRRHGLTLMEIYGEPLHALVKEGLGVLREEPGGGHFFTLSPKGLLLQNSVLLQLME